MIHSGEVGADYDVRVERAAGDRDRVVAVDGDIRTVPTFKVDDRGLTGLQA